MTALADFLLARIAEDEAMWRLALKADLVMSVRGPWPDAVPPTEFSKRMLADCEAKRRIVELAQGPDPDLWPGAELAVSALALPYADHPDYCEEWRP